VTPGQNQQPAQPCGLLVIYSALMLAALGELLTKLSRALLGEDADRNLISAKPPATAAD